MGAESDPEPGRDAGRVRVRAHSRRRWMSSFIVVESGTDSPTPVRRCGWPSSTLAAKAGR